MENFAQKVKQLREKLIMSQTEFAKFIGVSFTTVNRWENDKTIKPPYKQRRLLTELFEKHKID